MKTLAGGRLLAAILLTMAAALAACSPAPQRGDETEARDAAESYLDALRREDVGFLWERLTPATRGALYANDAGAFARDVGATDWSDLTWEIGPVTDYEISWGVHAQVAPAGVSVTLVDRGLFGGWGEEGIMILVQITDGGAYLVAGQGLDTDMR
jgi:hypothetical protein